MSDKSLIVSDDITHQLMQSSLDGKLPDLPFEENIYLATLDVTGMCFYEVDLITPNIKYGDTLILRRNPENDHDHYAIEVRTESHQMLGHIPRNHNRVLARLMDAGKSLTALVTKNGGKSSLDTLSVKVMMGNM